VNVVVAGCSPAWPNPGGAQSGYLVEEESGRLLLDCGPGVLPRLREREDWPRVDAIAISHFHLDHWGDLVPWTWSLMFGPGRDVEPPELWLPPGGAEQLRTFGRTFGSEEMFDSTFPIREYADGTAFDAAGLSITPFRVPHYGLLSFGFRVAGPEATLAYSADSGPADALAELARDADVFICEATLAESGEEGLRGHLSLDEAAAAFEASGAKRLLVTHRPSELPLADGFEQAQDGLEINL
jgi:ribonuclease BN (tRNA processing enzyme)